MDTAMERVMKTTVFTLGAALLLPAIGVLAQDAPSQIDKQVYERVHDRERGELSVNTQAPTRERMVNAIKSSTPTALFAMLEYGERVECLECIPLLERKLLDSDSAKVREISAWWLRRRPFGFGRVMVKMKTALLESDDPIRRSRAAEALGEFLDPHGLVALCSAVETDKSADVRLSAVRALGRLNAVGGNPVLVFAMLDNDARVRLAALESVHKVNFFSDYDAIIGQLADDDTAVRRTAAQLVGEFRVAEAVAPLVGLLLSDDDAVVRHAAAFSLGQLGGSDAFDALGEARADESDNGVLDAIDIALKMR